MADAPSDIKDRYIFRFPVKARLPWTSMRLELFMPNIWFCVGKKLCQLSKVRNHILGIPVVPDVRTPMQAVDGTGEPGIGLRVVSLDIITGTLFVPL